MVDLRNLYILVTISASGFLYLYSSAFADGSENVRMSFQQIKHLCDHRFQSIDTIINSENVRKNFTIDSISETDDGASAYIEFKSRISMELSGYIHIFRKDGHHLSQCGVSFYDPTQSKVGEFAKLVENVINNDLKITPLGGKLSLQKSSDDTFEEWYSFVVPDLIPESNGFATVAVLKNSLQLDYIVQVQDD